MKARERNRGECEGRREKKRGKEGKAMRKTRLIYTYDAKRDGA